MNRSSGETIGRSNLLHDNPDTRACSLGKGESYRAGNQMGWDDVGQFRSRAQVERERARASRNREEAAKYAALAEQYDRVADAYDQLLRGSSG